MISKQLFGRTGHQSSRIIFGAYALSKASQAEADRALALLLEKPIRGASIFRTIFILPLMVSPVVVGLIVYLLLSRVGPFGVFGLLCLDQF